MNCPKCNAKCGVTDSRPVSKGRIWRRRRICLSCHHRFTTYESEQLQPRKADAVKCFNARHNCEKLLLSLKELEASIHA
jgi:transcriptional regulator NrdR family protein